MLLSIDDICDLEEPAMGGTDEEGIGADAEEEVDVDFTAEDLLGVLEDEAGEESLCPETPPIEPVPSTPLAPACELAPARRRRQHLPLWWMSRWTMRRASILMSSASHQDPLVASVDFKHVAYSMQRAQPLIVNKFCPCWALKSLIE